MQTTQQAQPPQPPPYWGFWASIGFSLLIFIVFSLLQALFLVGYGFYLLKGEWQGDFADSLDTLVFNGNALAFAEIPAALIGAVLVILFASIPKIISAKDYLQIHFPSFLTILKWLAIMTLAIMMIEAINIIAERDVPDFMSKIFTSSHNTVLLWIAVIVGAPLFEELLFRGFLFESLKHSAVGFIGATLITATSWAIIHLQYDWYEIFTIFLFGILFAIAKQKTQSLYIPFFMHMLMNLTASIMMEIG